MNKIGIKEIVAMCLKNPLGKTPKAAMSFVQSKNPKNLWNVEIKENDLYIYHKIKSKTRTICIYGKNEQYNNLEILKAIGELYQLDTEDPEFLSRLRSIDLEKPMLRII